MISIDSKDWVYSIIWPNLVLSPQCFPKAKRRDSLIIIFFKLTYLYECKGIVLHKVFYSNLIL